MGLSLKPTKPSQPNLTMEQLDYWLQEKFSSPTGQILPVIIDTRNYIPSKEEIINSAKQAGYKVSEISDFELRFE